MTRFFGYTSILFFLFLLKSPQIIARQEFSLEYKLNNQLYPIPIEVYTYNYYTKCLVLHDSGTAANYRKYGLWYDAEINAAFDICQTGTPLSNPTVSRVDCVNKIYIKVNGYFIILTLEDGDNYGDVVVSIIDGIFDERYNSSDYSVEYIKSDLKTLTLKNDFGGDRDSANVKGKIFINSEQLNDVGYSGTTQYREATTFPHTISGEDNQYIETYYRKWRNWNQVSDSNIHKTLSVAQDYNNITAVYARKCNLTVQNDFGASGSGGNIKFQSVQYSSPYQPSTAYEDIEYNVQALNHNINYIEYTFNY